MSEFKGTPGPWRKTGSVIRAVGGVERKVADVRVTDAEGEANAKLIVSAPDLFWALKIKVDNAEQRGFEDWLTRTAPSGDCDSVHSQWLESSDYEDFVSDWDLQITAIAKATE